MKQTQSQWILAKLQQGPVTAMDALDGCGCFRLAARIADLRQAGYHIETENRTLANNKTVAVYHLKEKETA
ncbi:helix-turn-helix domain-containing protein [Limnohabitans sp.]|uniref:helix-turn-helix domain-containing protein n=1 Tax=Limnohabitans sp. TaxID=1907725 RepID=UPI0025B7D2DE|nr:helix-turn-helix domain-containing protein [Limnohabitans sp.]